jgi:hypothetical protein
VTPHRLGLLVVEGAAAAGRNVAADLKALSVTTRHEVFSRAAALADAGRLRDAVTALGAPTLIARAAGDWPGALQTARVAVERLPSTRSLGLGLAVLGSFCLVVGFVQLVVGAILGAKVLPVFASGPWSHFVMMSDPRDALVLFIPLQLVVWLAAWSSLWWKRSPWNRDLALARHAAVVASLLESKAPADVVAAWLSSEPRLAVGGGHVVRAQDLRSVATSFGSRAEASMRRFLAVFRFVAVGLLVLEAAWMLRAVLVAISHIPGSLL